MEPAPRALVSFVNIGPQPAGRLGCLGLINFDDRTARSVRSADSRIRSHMGGTGLAHWNDGYVLLINSSPTQAVVLDADFAVTNVLDLPPVVDAHSILALDDVWLAVATGSDSVVAIDPKTGISSILWRAPGDWTDVVHVNSVFTYKGSIGITAMGRRHGSLASSIDGLAMNLMTGEVLMRPIFHPHSGREVDEELVVCESSRGRLRSSTGSILPVPLGYVRGFDVTADHVIVGTSRHRGSSLARCSVQLYERTGQQIEHCQRAGWIHTGELGPEIFDMVAIRQGEAA